MRDEILFNHFCGFLLFVLTQSGCSHPDQGCGIPTLLLCNGDAMNNTLYQIDEVSDLYVDAFLMDQSQLIFLSVWGRDTALQEFFARLTLPKSEHGLREIHLESLDSNQTHFVDIPDIDKLDKTNGRVQTRVFGQLSHVFIYDKLAVKPDALNNRALLFYRDEKPDIWEIVKEACHLPLLDHWKESVLSAFQQQGWIQTLDGEGIHAIKINFVQEDVERLLEFEIKEGSLTLKEGVSAPVIKYQPVASSVSVNNFSDAVKAIKLLDGFIGNFQLQTIADGCRSEEKQFFFDKLAEMANLIETMPKTGEQEDKGDEAIAFLHYFSGSFDWYISEKDMLDDQFQAFGLGSMGYPEYGYISIVELIENNVELDLHFKPEPLKVLKQRLERDQPI